MNCSIFQKFYLNELVKLLSLKSWPEKTADILRCHHWFPCEMTTLSSERKNSILKMYHFSDLGSASDCSCPK